MVAILFIIAVIFAIGAYKMHRSANRDEKEFANRPAVISNPATDLFTNQKYAIVGLIAIFQGASPLTAYNEDVNNIMNDTTASLGLTRQDVERFIKNSMKRDPEREFERIILALKGIRDHNYIRQLKEKISEIAHISGDIDIIETVDEIFKELGC